MFRFQFPKRFQSGKEILGQRKESHERTVSRVQRVSITKGLRKKILYFSLLSEECGKWSEPAFSPLFTQPGCLKELLKTEEMVQRSFCGGPWSPDIYQIAHWLSLLIHKQIHVCPEVSSQIPTLFPDISKVLQKFISRYLVDTEGFHSDSVNSCFLSGHLFSELAK